MSVFTSQAFATNQDQIRFDVTCDIVCIYSNWKTGNINGTPNPEYYPTPVSFNLDNVNLKEFESVTKNWIELRSICEARTPEKYKDNNVNLGGNEYAKPLTEKTVKCDIQPKATSEDKIDAACSYTCAYEAEHCWDGCWDAVDYSIRYIDLKGLTKKDFNNLSTTQLDLNKKCEENPAESYGNITIKKSLGASGLHCLAL